MDASHITLPRDRVQRRRLAIQLPCALAAVAGWPAAHAQRGPARIGFLTPSAPPQYEKAFWEELHRLGHVKDKTIVVESRSAEGRFDRLPALAAELVALKVDIIVAVVTQASVAARDATATIPIVMVGVADPVGAGLVKSLARPGANVTGTSIVAAEVVGKQLELLRQLMPRASRVAVLWNPANEVFQQQLWARANEAAAKLSLQLQPVRMRTPDDVEQAFATMRTARVNALLIMADPMLAGQATSIARLAAQDRMVAVGATRVFVEAGIVASYGPHFVDSFRRAAGYVDRILKGARPGDLAVEQSTTFELVINNGAARRLGLTIPQSVALRADQVID
jgi:putative tryptophan/tyrosine transport system substrate-binding protein